MKYVSSQPIHNRLAMNNLAVNSSIGRGQERGMALIVGLLLLLIMTILGIAAMRGTFQQERMSANNQQQTITFQGAEAAIRTVMDEVRGITSPQPATSVLVLAMNNGQVASTLPDSQGLMSYKFGNVVTISSDEQTKADTDPNKTNHPATTGNSTTNTARVYYTGTSAAVNSSAKYVAYNFVVDSTSQQTNTFAASHHQQGISHDGPSPEGVVTTNKPAP